MTETPTKNGETRHQGKMGDGLCQKAFKRLSDVGATVHTYDILYTVYLILYIYEASLINIRRSECTYE